MSVYDLKRTSGDRRRQQLALIQIKESQERRADV